MILYSGPGADEGRIFGCFSLQEIGTLAHRSDISDSVGRTLALTTDLDLSDPVEPEKPEERALIMYVFLESGWPGGNADEQRPRSRYCSRCIRSKRLPGRYRRYVSFHAPVAY